MTEDKVQKDEQTNSINELEELKKKCEEYLNGWKRAKADYLNLKKETAEKQEDWADFIQAGLLLEILPIINNYKIALSHIPEEAKKEAWVEGFNHIYKQFIDLLNKLGITEIKTVGEKFNPEFHEAVSQEINEEAADQQILKELSPGYQMNDKVITPAKVVVNVKNN